MRTDQLQCVSLEHRCSGHNIQTNKKLNATSVKKLGYSKKGFDFHAFGRLAATDDRISMQMLCQSERNRGPFVLPDSRRSGAQGDPNFVPKSLTVIIL